MKAEKITMYIVDPYEVPDADTLQDMLIEFDIESYVGEIKETEFDVASGDALSADKLKKYFEGV